MPGDGARNVALLYLFGSGGGQALCPLVTYLMDVGGVPENLLWRWSLGIGIDHVHKDLSTGHHRAPPNPMVFISSDETTISGQTQMPKLFCFLLEFPKVLGFVRRFVI